MSLTIAQMLMDPHMEGFGPSNPVLRDQGLVFVWSDWVIRPFLGRNNHGAQNTSQSPPRHTRSLSFPELERIHVVGESAGGWATFAWTQEARRGAWRAHGASRARLRADTRGGRGGRMGWKAFWDGFWRKMRNWTYQVDQAR